MTKERPARGALVITVRLFPEVHGRLTVELQRAARGVRAARAVHLMTVGLLHEQFAASVPAPDRPLAGSALPRTDAEVAARDQAFVAAIVDSWTAAAD